MRHMTTDPKAETLGLLLNSFSENLQGDTTRPAMEKHGMVDLEPMEWYPVQKLLDALNELNDSHSAIFDMTAIGLKIGENVPIPPEIGEPTLEKVLNIWDDLYQGLHRGANVGKITVEKVDNKHFITRHTNPYPDDMSYGILYAYGRRFLPKGTDFIVYYDEELGTRDYNDEADAAIIHIEWK